LAAVLISANQTQKAQDYAKKALRIARTNGYKVLAARALLLTGRSAKSSRRKQLCLLGALQNATEMSLPELVSESAFHMGLFQFEAGNYITAREHLIRSIAVTTELAEELSATLRSAYTARAWRPDARKLLEQCNRLLQRESYALARSERSGNEDRFFKTIYRLTISATTANNFEAFITSLVETIETALTRPAIITLKSTDVVITKTVRIRLSDKLIQRIMSLSTRTQNRIYFGCPDKTQPKDSVAWIPLRSQRCEGGIYVTSRCGESGLNEREMEFLTILGMIGNGALQRIESRDVDPTRMPVLTEFHGIIGASKVIREVYSHIEIAAGNAATVLIEGESGTGKELVAKAIHETGQRAKEAFVAVDCGAIPETLIEVELFGAKKGSYTGAVTDRPGLFEAAHRGTIFLDEISNTSPAVQAKLLRVLQEREVRRIGETKGRPVDVRLIVASNASLDALVEEGRFRKDLLYRLKVLHIKLPPLRNRRDDIPMLAHAFLDRLNLTNKTRKHFAPGVINQLMTHAFPGNVRELQNAIERAFFSAKGTMIEEVPLEHRAEDVASMNEVQTWFKDLADGRKDFWSAVHNRYKRRDISREKVIALVDFGLRSTHGSYKTMASLFRLKKSEYRRFMDFLRRNDCLLDFRPYRKAADNNS
jgi:transcriptional regulator with GAF, ATPase, and Fis domain